MLRHWSSWTSLITFARAAEHFPRTTLDSWPTRLKSLEVKRIRVPRYAEDLRTIKFLTVKPLVGLIASADQLKSSWPVAGIATVFSLRARDMRPLGMGSSITQWNSIFVSRFSFHFCTSENASFYISVWFQYFLLQFNRVYTFCISVHIFFLYKSTTISDESINRFDEQLLVFNVSEIWNFLEVTLEFWKSEFLGISLEDPKRKSRPKNQWNKSNNAYIV